MGANCMYQISSMVAKQVGSSDKMHVLLIDPMILDRRPGGHAFVETLAFFGLPLARVVRDGTPYIEGCPGYIDLSGGSIINMDASLNPLRVFNGDRHYPWKGRTSLQKKILEYLDGKFDAALCRSYE